MFAEIGVEDRETLDRMEEASERYFRQALEDGTYRGWLAETEAGRVVSGGGVAIVHWPGSPDFPATRRGWILNVYTDPDHRHRGIARQVMETILQWCRENRFSYVSLHASQFGRELYEKMGFAPTNEMRIHLRP
jgi:GNAT superfamily N-acetyltransferase